MCMCNMSKPRAFKLIALSIIWLHLFISTSLVLGIVSLGGNNQRPLATRGAMEFYLLCFSALSIVPILLALSGIYKSSSLFMVPYIMCLMTMLILLVVAIIVIILGMIFEPQNVLDKWTTSRTLTFNQTLVDIWLTIFAIGLVIAVVSMCFFFVFSYYKILLRQEERNQLRYIETTNGPIYPAISSPAAAEAQRGIAALDPATSRLINPTSVSRSASNKNLADDEDDPPPSYSRAQSIILHSYA